ncbi:MAG: glucosidase [Rhabdochlamydiaceae bacterium]|nr:glucosidase [Rhabdochlamydiaceae bacterium]
MPSKKTKVVSEEEKRIHELGPGPVPTWQKWGPYVSERAWGTVREDYSPNGDAWSYFPFEQAHLKAYRWGDDGIAGWCDRYQVLLFSPAFWNGKDPILKERLYGLNSYEGNHAEDVKELYYYLDGTPTHSYMKYLYKYPQGEFPYEKLKLENRKRTGSDPEYELIDTGIFDQKRYFDIVIEYAKSSAEDLCIKIEVFNRGDKEASLHVIPQLWFRNQWSWGDRELPKPEITNASKKKLNCLIADDTAMQSPSNLSFEYRLGKRYLYGPPGKDPLFTQNETRFVGAERKGSYYKDGIQRKIIDNQSTVCPDLKGSKAALHYVFESIPPQKSVVLYLRLTDKPMADPLKDVEKTVLLRKKEADQFYATVHPKKATKEEKAIQRQAIAGVLWNKQIYLFDVHLWLKGDNSHFPPPASRNQIRNVHWLHLNSMRILVMPDKWEYPWFAAWDHAFHCLTLGLVDLNFAKEQLWLLLFDQFQHPNGQIPAYEWEFSDINPPVQAWAALRLYEMEKEKNGEGDRDFLQRCFHKLLMNFSWWVNKVDSSGNNVFEGGFLGMDNISLVDRSLRMAGGIKLQQSDGTGWMALFCLNLMRIALELAKKNKVYESLATKFFEHYVYIGHAMKKRGNQNYEMWSEKDGFFYDVLTYPDGKFAKFRVRSMVGIIPIYAVEFLHEDELKRFPDFQRDFFWFLNNRQDLVAQCIIPFKRDKKTEYVLSLMNHEQIQSVLKYIWDPKEFRSNFGLRSLSKFHEENPFEFQNRKITYEPAESIERIKGGNSNWRGPIWMPTNFMLIDALKRLSMISKDELNVTLENGDSVNLKQMAEVFANSLIGLFKKDADGNRPFLGPQFPFKEDPNWNSHLQFFEYYHPETGKGLGASHQTGWSALVANLIDEFRRK